MTGTSIMAPLKWLSETRLRGVLLALGLVCVVAVLDYATGREIAFSFFYVVPVLLATWAAGSTVGILFAVFSGLTFVYTDLLADTPFSSGWIPFWNFAVRAATLMTIALLASMLKDRLDYERNLARMCPLTGIPNARAFRDRLQLECDRVTRLGPPLSVAYLDLDGFKSVNDRYGHEAGDELLERMGSALRESVRAVDMVGRLGGDEFAVLLVGADEKGAATAIERVRASISRLDLESSGVDCCVGLATLQYRNPTPHDALRLADRLMYEAKREGRGNLKARSFHEPPVRETDDLEGLTKTSG